MANAQSIRAGQAHVELGVDAKPLDNGLKETTNKLKMFAEGIKKAGKAEMVGGALTGGAMGMLAAAGGIAGKTVFDEFILNQRVMQREVERSEELTSRWLERFSADLDKVRQKVAAFQAELGTGQGMTKLETELEAAEKNLIGLESALKSTRKQFEAYDTIFEDKDFAEAMRNYGLYLTAPITGGLEGEQAKLKPNLDKINAAYQKQLEVVTELKKQKNELLDPTRSVAGMKAITDFTAQLKDDMDALTSTVSNREKAFGKIAQQFGLGPANSEWQQTMAAIKKVDAAEAVEKFVKAVDDQTDRINNAHLEDREFEFMKLAEKNDWGPANPEWQRGMDALKNLRIAEAVEAAQKWGEEDIAAMQSSSRGSQAYASGSQFFSVAGAGSGTAEKMLKAEERTNKLLEGVTDILQKADGLVIA